jgi:hypothetical protein
VSQHRTVVAQSSFFRVKSSEHFEIFLLAKKWRNTFKGNSKNSDFALAAWRNGRHKRPRNRRFGFVSRQSVIFYAIQYYVVICIKMCIVCVCMHIFAWNKKSQNKI